MTYRINIQLSEQEFEALRTVSLVQLRHPRDQVRMILRDWLMNSHETSAPNNNKPALTVEGAGGFVEQR